ncbi:MAG: hypothetical protein LQ342_007387 [Letrouitia transgressa]|nr:MAG: hypothetical protein LQ342_007387 [Letrouitia transgressa]
MTSRGKVCLAYSGGLEEDWDQVRSKATKLGASKMEIVDLRKEFVETMLFPAIQCNAQYEGRYLLGTSLARPIIARAQIKYVLFTKLVKMDISGVTQTKYLADFELAYQALSGGKISCLAPWRDPDFFQRFQGRNDLLAYAKKMGIPVTQTTAKPYSMDDNLAHCSYESGQLEDPSKPPPDDMWTRTDDPMTGPATPQFINIQFEKGIPVKVSSEGNGYTDSLELFIALNAIGKTHGVGRIDIVENRSLGGLKSRGCYDSPAMTILRLAHLDLEGLVLDGRVRSLRDQFVTHSYTELIYSGLYFSPEREFVENSLVFAQRRVNGEVKLRLYRGNCDIVGRSSETEKLYSEEESSMDSLVDFSPVDTKFWSDLYIAGFININAIRLKKYGLQNLEEI